MNPHQSLLDRARLMSEAGYFAPDSDEVVPSPCISVCRMTEDRARCEGCLRTLEEIRGWSAASPEARRATWVRVLQRAGVSQPDLEHLP